MEAEAEADTCLATSCEAAPQRPTAATGAAETDSAAEPVALVPATATANRVAVDPGRVAASPTRRDMCNESFDFFSLPSVFMPLD